MGNAHSCIRVCSCTYQNILRPSQAPCCFWRLNRTYFCTYSMLDWEVWWIFSSLYIHILLTLSTDWIKQNSRQNKTMKKYHRALCVCMTVHTQKGKVKIYLWALSAKGWYHKQRSLYEATDRGTVGQQSNALSTCAQVTPRYPFAVCRSNCGGIGTLLSLPARHCALVDAVAGRWISTRPSKYASLISQFLENVNSGRCCGV